MKISSSHDIHLSRNSELVACLNFTARFSPYYRDLPWAQKLREGKTVRFEDIPITSKATVQALSQKLRIDNLPQWAGRILTKATAGSTGFPTTVYKSASHFTVNQMETDRLKAPWNLQAYKTQLSFIRPDDVHPAGTIEREISAGGAEKYRLYSLESDHIEAFVQQKHPSLLRARPSTIQSLLEMPLSHDFLSLVITLTEAISDRFSQLVGNLPHCSHLDIYGSTETGIIAAKCPDCGNYHLAHRNVYLEILNERDTPAQESELGRVVVTVISNPAMPLIRYDLGDMVRFTRNSPCEPGQISLQRIYGRERMIFHLPGGGRILPHLRAIKTTGLGIKRFKLVQVTKDTIEFHYEGFAPDFIAPEGTLERLIAEEISPEFTVIPKKVTQFPLAPSGKYIMFERLIDNADVRQASMPQMVAGEGVEPPTPGL